MVCGVLCGTCDVYVCTCSCAVLTCVCTCGCVVCVCTCGVVCCVGGVLVLCVFACGVVHGCCVVVVGSAVCGCCVGAVLVWGGVFCVFLCFSLNSLHSLSCSLSFCLVCLSFFSPLFSLLSSLLANKHCIKALINKRGVQLVGMVCG